MKIVIGMMREGGVSIQVIDIDSCNIKNQKWRRAQKNEGDNMHIAVSQP
jgi:hypothetical protein